MKVLETFELTKIYGNKKVVDSLNISINRGKIFGFLGANGAGKTTTIRMLSTLIDPTTGSASVLGYDLLKHGGIIRRKISVIPQNSSLNLFLDVHDNIYVYLLLRGYTRKKAKLLTENAIQQYSLDEHINKKPSQLSGGFRRRVALAQALASESSLIFLDEPTVGLDPHSKHITWEIMRNARKKGKTIFLTTQSMEEAEALSDDVCFIRNGKAIEIGNLDALKELYGKEKALVITDRLDNNQIVRLKNNLSYLFENESIRINCNENILEVDNLKTLSILLNYLHESYILVKSLEVKKASLEEIYFKIMEIENV